MSNPALPARLAAKARCGTSDLETQMESILETVGLLRRAAQRLGPYLLIEILLPGGTLLALMLLVYRRWRRCSYLSRPADRVESPALSTAPRGAPAFDVAMIAFVDCAGAASSSRNASSRKIGMNRCPA